MINSDCKNVSFEEFIEFFFDHPPTQIRGSEWYKNEALKSEFELNIMLEHYTRLFSAPHFLFGSFTLKQIDQGFWAILFVGQISKVLLSDALDFGRRKKCVESMYFLCKDCFAVKTAGDASHMWWSCIAIQFEFGHYPASEKYRLRNVVFETMCRVLGLDSEECQGSALEGLKELHHPDKNKVLTAFIDSHPELDEDTLEFIAGIMSDKN
jgi:hypothetical protein